MPLESKNYNLEKSNQSIKYALMAVNIDEREDIFYFFYLPFIVQAWKKLNFQPIVLLVSSEDSDIKKFNNNNGPAMTVIKYLIELGATIKLVKSEKDYEKITSMICRLFIGSLEFLDEEDYVLTSDSDLIPIRSKYYEINDFDKITIWNSECCGRFIYKNTSYKMFPMAHIGMKKKHWKGVMNLASSFAISSKTIMVLLESFYKKNYFKKNNNIKRGDAVWYSDQIILSQKIEIYSNVLEKAKIIQKPYKGIRLDRIQSYTSMINLVENKFYDLTDFHAFHKNFLERWKVTSKLITKMFKNDSLRVLFSYFSEFKNSN